MGSSDMVFTNKQTASTTMFWKKWYDQEGAPGSRKEVGQGWKPPWCSWRPLWQVWRPRWEVFRELVVTCFRGKWHYPHLQFLASSGGFLVGRFDLWICFVLWPACFGFSLQPARFGFNWICLVFSQHA